MSLRHDARKGRAMNMKLSISRDSRRRAALALWLTGLLLTLSCAALSPANLPGPAGTDTAVPSPSATQKPTNTPTPAVTPTLGPRAAWRNSRIAFASNRGGSFQIYLVNPDGSKLVQLTDSEGDNVSPAWSLDAKHIAFATTRDGNSEIYVMDPDGMNQRNLTKDPSNDYAPLWLPNDKLAFVSNRKGRERIFLMDLEAKADLRSFQYTSVESSTRFLCLMWVSEGWLGFTTQDGGARETRVVDTANGDTWRPDALKGEHDRSCDLLPALTSNPWVVFVSNRDGHDEIYKYNLQSDAEVQLTKDSVSSFGPSRSSDETWISFYSQRGGDWDIYVMGSDGKNQWDITNDPADDIQPAWEPY
jgi:Tol biopolymer transport system component